MQRRGSLRQLDPHVTVARNLAFFAYALGDIEGLEISSQEELLMKLSEFHFQVNPNYKKWDSIEGVIQGVNDWEVRRHDLGYDTDGMVIKVNDFAQRGKAWRNRQGSALGHGLQVPAGRGRD